MKLTGRPGLGVELRKSLQGQQARDVGPEWKESLAQRGACCLSLCGLSSPDPGETPSTTL